jgi:hypothetical protein
MTAQKFIKSVLSRLVTILWLSIIILFLFCLLNFLIKTAILIYSGYYHLVPEIISSWRTTLMLALLTGILLLRKQIVFLAQLLDSHSYLFEKLFYSAFLFYFIFNIPVLLSHGENTYINSLDQIADFPREEVRFDEKVDYRPEIAVIPNNLGYRDDDFTEIPQKDTRRIAIIGDSYVYGMGISNPDEVIDRQIERELQKLTGQKWEVMNFGFPQLGFRSYFRIASRVIDMFNPEAVIIGSNGHFDLDFYSVQTFYEDYKGSGYKILKMLDVSRDLIESAIRFSYRLEDSSRVYQILNRTEISLFKDEFDTMIDKSFRKGVAVFIWEYKEPFAFFDPYRSNSPVKFLTWTEEFIQVKRKYKDQFEFTSGHPNGRTNRFMAKIVARGITDHITGTSSGSP